MKLTTREEVKEILLNDLPHLEEYEYEIEFVESLAQGEVPVYYGQIIEQWTQLTNNESNRFEEIGYEPNGETTIYSLMEIDLYLYYKDLFLSVYNEILDEQEEKVGA
jgi:hypothetical protein